jgi:aerobic carbon-monoxide dehydrogenase medium subunit
MRLAATAYVRPTSVEDALAALAATAGSRVLAGGQTLINVLKHRAASVELLVDVSRLEELRSIEVGADGSVSIGAATTYRELDRSSDLRAAQPIIAEVASCTVDRQVRARGTIGGNVCFADPASNFPPLLVALDATLVIATASGPRSVPASEFFVGLYRTAVGPGELLGKITVPPLNGGGVGYQSLQIAADSWALARAVACVCGEETITAARVVLGCVAATPMRAAATEAAVLGGAATAAAVSEAAAMAADGLEPPSDVHASSSYRREMVVVMAKRALLEAIDARGRGGHRQTRGSGEN